jgi:hypothetical protein
MMLMRRRVLLGVLKPNLRSNLRPDLKSINIQPYNISKLALSTLTDTKSKAEKPETKIERRETDVRILNELGKHLWPDKNHPDSYVLKTRVLTAVSLLVASKVINIQVPFLFKYLVDSFEIDHTALTSTVGDPLLLATPFAVVMGYGTC